MNVFNDTLILILHIFDFFLEVFELHMKSFDLFHSSDVSRLADWLSN